MNDKKEYFVKTLMGDVSVKATGYEVKDGSLGFFNEDEAEPSTRFAPHFWCVVSGHSDVLIRNEEWGTYQFQLNDLGMETLVDIAELALGAVPRGSEPGTASDRIEQLCEQIKAARKIEQPDLPEGGLHAN